MGSDWMCMARMVLDRTSTDREGRRGRRSLDTIMDISPALKCRLLTAVMMVLQQLRPIWGYYEVHTS
jgi:hypothetical protein